MNKKLYLYIFTTILFAGCSTSSPYTQVTVYSQPAGAYITALFTPNAAGIAPYTLYFDLRSMQPNKNGCYQVNGYKARWVSGAIDEHAILNLCGIQPAVYTDTARRDSSLPGLDKDLDFVSQMHLPDMQRAAVEAAKKAVNAEQEGSVNNTNK